MILTTELTSSSCYLTRRTLCASVLIQTCMRSTYIVPYLLFYAEQVVELVQGVRFPALLVINGHSIGLCSPEACKSWTHHQWSAWLTACHFCFRFLRDHAQGLHHSSTVAHNQSAIQSLQPQAPRNVNARHRVASYLQQARFQPGIRRHPLTKGSAIFRVLLSPQLFRVAFEFSAERGVIGKRQVFALAPPPATLSKLSSSKLRYTEQ